MSDEKSLVDHYGVHSSLGRPNFQKGVISFDQNALNREGTIMCGEFGPKKGVINSDDSEFGLEKRCHQFRLEKTSLKQPQHKACLDE